MSQDSNVSVHRSDTTKRVKGFLHTLSHHKKISRVKIAYQIDLFIFYLLNFLYSLILFVIEGQNPVYNIVSGTIALIGILVEAGKMIIQLIRWIGKRCSSCQVPPTNNISAEPEGPQGEGVENDTSQGQTSQERNSNNENETGAMELFVEYIFDSLEEILIYPSIICALYGFINEKGWQLESAIDVIDFILLLYDLVMDAIYTKL